MAGKSETKHCIICGKPAYAGDAGRMARPYKFFPLSGYVHGFCYATVEVAYRRSYDFQTLGGVRDAEESEMGN